MRSLGTARSLVLSGLLLLPACVVPASAALAQVTGRDDELAERRTRALEDRFIAPCCWTESLAIHDSPVAIALREEIHARLQAGEAPQSIEADLVARHGERILSTPPGIEPVAALVLLLVAASGLVLYGTLRRRARSGERTAAAREPPVDAARDARLDAELERELRSLEP